MRSDYLVNLNSVSLGFYPHIKNGLDQRLINSVSKDDFASSTIEEIIQEYIMNKLDYMNEYKYAISNIINFYLNNPKFFLISLQSTKKSIYFLLSNFSFSQNAIKKKLLEKSLLILFLIAFKKWLYEDSTNNISFALIDKGIKRIKKSTSLFEAIKKN